MSVLITPKVNAANGATKVRDWLSPLNLHWAGVGLLALVNVYLLAHMALLWHEQSTYNADAQAQQKIELKAAEVSAMPLRGLDEKVSTATAQADKFYADRFPGTDSEMLTELGALAKKAGVRLTGVQYPQEPVLAGSAGELMEERIDARLSGDYRPLVQFLNSLERDKMFFVIKGVTLTGQQTGTVNLRLRLTTYLRGTATQGAGTTSGTEAASIPAGGAQ